MPLFVAQQYLSQATRHGTVLKGRGFDQADYQWQEACWSVATGSQYLGASQVTMMETGDYAQTTFNDEDAEQLIHLGQPGQVKEDILPAHDQYEPWELRF